MLVGDYCARALDPIFLLEHIIDEEIKEETKGLKEALERTDLRAEKEGMLKKAEPAELPCNVFGTVDRCDGMACEHDGNCFSGCCALFVSGD